jgi:predicted RNase H-like HicB family nuclease
MTAAATSPTTASLDDYVIVLQRDEDTFVAMVPSIQGCHAMGVTRAEALSEIELVFRMIAEIAEEDGEELPLEHLDGFSLASQGSRAAARRNALGVHSAKAARSPRNLATSGWPARHHSDLSLV